MENNLTLFDKVWESHIVKRVSDGPDILFIDRHLVHEVTSPVAFQGMKKRNIKVLFPNRTFATADHNTPTINQHLPVKDPMSANQLKTLEKNKYAKEIGFMLKSLQLSKSIKSNKTVSFRVLAQIASAVPKRVKFSKIEYNGSDLVVIEGTAFSDQDILKLISNLNNKKLISQASLASMTLPQGQQQGSQTMKGFKVACVLEQV